MEKPKKDKNRAPDRLVWAIPFEFVSPLSLDDCSALIEAIKSPYNKIYLSSVEQKKTLFHVSQQGFKAPEAWAVGNLEALAEGHTRVSGKIGIEPSFLITVGFFVVFGLIVLPAALESIYTFIATLASLYTMMFLLIFLMIRMPRSGLLNLLRKRLEGIEKSTL
jgi:hypothetical protein